MGRGAYLVRRIIQMPIVLTIITVVLFSLMHVTPGDPVTIWLGVNTTEEIRESMSRHYGLDKPIHEQYFRWVSNIVRGDFGRSIRTSESVLDMILDRLPTTLILATLALLLSLLIAVPLGIISAYKHNTYVDNAAMLGATIGLSAPDFAIGILLILVFAVTLGWFPSFGTGNLLADPLGSLRGFILPAIALAVSRAAGLTRLLRATMLDVLGSQYIVVAKSRGLSSQAILFTHALRNAIIPLVTAIGLTYALLIGGAIAVEWLFALPGVGNLLVNAVIHRDFPVIQGITLWIAIVLVSINLAIDFVYTIIDPRIQYS